MYEYMKVQIIIITSPSLPKSNPILRKKNMTKYTKKKKEKNYSILKKIINNKRKKKKKKIQ